MKKLLLALALFLLPISAEAASRFWVPLVVTGAISGTGGLCRLTVNDTVNLSASASVIVAGILGATACDGTTTVTTVVDATHVEVNLAFGLAYTSGGTVAGGKWTSTGTGNWSATTGGAGGASVPGSSDPVTFDASSGGGVVTADSTINGSNTIPSLTMGAFTGTLDFSINNPSVSMASMSISGTGTRTLKLGSGTFTLTAVGTTNMFDAGTTTGLTFLCGTSTIAIAPSSAPNSSFGMAGGGLTYNNVSFTFGSSTARPAFLSGNNTINVLTIGQNINMQFGSGGTQTLTSLVANGAAGSSGLLLGGASGVATISIASGSINLSWIGVRSLVFSGGATFTAGNSLDLGGNTGIAITPPSSGGRIIGG